MDQLSFTEENYLKAIYFLQEQDTGDGAAVNDIAERVHTKPATVTDMLRKLSDKELIHYEKYKKTQLTQTGLQHALQVIRKHRLWEVFLYQELKFTWDQVHDIAEQLEHIQSPQLVEKLDEYLGYPQFDPHGDPIPTAQGEVNPASTITLAMATANEKWRIVAVKDTSVPFLQYLENTSLQIGTEILLKDIIAYDGSVVITLKNKKNITLSEKAAQNLLVALSSQVDIERS